MQKVTWNAGLGLARAVVGALAFSLALVACGGGGGGESATPPQPTTRQALPTLVSDDLPAGARPDHRSENFFPMAAGDSWRYDYRYNGALYTIDRSVALRADGQTELRETLQGETSTYLYRRTDAGLVLTNPLGTDLPAAAQALVGELLAYPEPFYAVGGLRRVLRQGSWGADEDGDGVHESLRVEFTQVFEGMEPLQLNNGSVVQAARFSNSLKVTLQPSRLSSPVDQITQTETTWWGAGAGMLRTDGSLVETGSSTSSGNYSLVLTSGTGAGAKPFQSAGSINSTLRLNLLHNGLVYDSTRGVYYASVPGSVVGTGNRVATIDATTGAVSHSGAIGSEPGALSLSADGSSLYVGLNGSGEVLRLALPGMTAISRTRLPAESFYGQTQAEQISVSPVDASVAAVSLAYTGISPRHGGVVLLRAGVLQPVKTQGHTGSNLISFSGDGQSVYGFNNETTEFGLRRLAVQTDGLAETQVVSAGGTFGGRSMAWTGAGLWLGSVLYSTPALQRLGTVNVSGNCRPMATGVQLLCLNMGGTSSGQLVLVDAASFTLLNTLAYDGNTAEGQATDLLPGPSGQVALRFGGSFWHGAATGLWLVNTQALSATPR